MLYQLVLFMTTKGDGLRSEAIAWECEDPREFQFGKPIGYTRGPKFNYTYDTVLEALANGWKLLAPPEKGEGETYWILVRELSKE